MSRLTDEEINGLQRFVNGDDGPRPIHIVWTDRALAELRERRSNDLTAEEREALRVLLADIKRAHARAPDPMYPPPHGDAIPVLDRLLARANGGGK